MSSILNAALATQAMELLKQKALKGDLTLDELNQILTDIDNKPELQVPFLTETGTTTEEVPTMATTAEDQVIVEKLTKDVQQFKQHRNPSKGGNMKKQKQDVFRPVLGGVQLQPQTEAVWGMHIVPILNQKGEVTDIRGQMANIEIAKVSAFRAIEGMEFVTIDHVDAGIKAQCLWRYQRAVTARDRAEGKPEHEWRIAVGNIKKSDCVMGILPKHRWDAFFGCDCRMLNLWKVILPIMTPTGVEIKEEFSNIKTMRFRVLDAMVTPWGYPEHDGDCVTKVWHEFYRHADLVNGQPKQGARPKKVNRNWQFRATGLTVQGRVMPAIKAKMYADDKKYLRMCERFQFIPESQDAFITKDNLKTLKWEYAHGDILEIPITNIRNVKNKMKGWSSSMGAQCVANSDFARTREVLNGHGIIQKAEIIKGATELRLNQIISVMESDQEASWDDALGMPVKCAFGRFTEGDWFAPRMFRDPFYIRVESFYRDHGIKVQIDKDGYYLQGDDQLDALENAVEESTGKLQYYVWLPKTSKFIGKLVKGDKVDIGRDPNVGPSNLMTFEVAGFNDSHDAMVCSWQAIYSLFGDVDGDTCKYETLIANTSERVFPCIRRKAPGLGKEKPVMTEFPSMTDYLFAHESVGLGVLKSAADTGSLDLATRQIIEERMYANLPMNLSELMELAELRQEAIDGLKHTDSGVAADAKDILVKTYGVSGMLSKLKDSPMTYRLLRKDAGQPRWNEVHRLIERIKLINMAQPHPAHPYFDFFMALKGVALVAKGSDMADAEWLFNQCNSLLLEAQSMHSKGAYGFKFTDVTEMGKWMSAYHIAEARKYIKMDEDTRKEAFTKLREYQRSIVKQKCIELFGNDDSDMAIKYQRQLTIFLGTKGFGRGQRTEWDEEGREHRVSYAKTGGAIWNMLEEHTLFLARIINERAVARGEFPCVNPFMEKIEQALVRNREKAAEKAIARADAVMSAA